MAKIGIDPGHGGNDPGAIAASGLQEKDVNLAVGLSLEELLKRIGIKTIMSRTGDEEISLSDRAALFNREQTDLIVSIHVNSEDSLTAAYISTFILALGGRAEKAAKPIQRELVAATGWPDGGIRVANFYILRETKAATVLLEMGFISHANTADLLARQSTQRSLAWAIFRGLGAYLGFKVSDYQGHWAESAIRQVLGAGLMSGYPDGTFRPDQGATRAELAAALVRFLPKLKHTLD